MAGAIPGDYNQCEYVQPVREKSPGHSLHPKIKPFPSALLHSAVTPTEDEKLSIEHDIEESKLSLCEINEEIERLKANLAALEAHRFTVARRLAKREAVFSPLRRVPPEILGEIFLHYQAGASVVWPHTKHTEDIPWKLGRVCGYWRSVFVTLPQLWSNIQIELSTIRIQEGSNRVQTRAHEFLQTCLRRSGNEPLSLSLRYQPSRDLTQEERDNASELAASLLTVLVGASERWQAVDLDLEEVFMYNTILAPARDHVPMLQSLSLASSIERSTPSPRPWQAIDAFFNAPKLTRLTMANISHPTHHLRLPWSQLKYLSSKHSNFLEGEFSRILKEASLLEEFRTEDERVLEVAHSSISGPAFPTTNGSPPPHNGSAIYLPRLHTLGVVNKSSYINRIFQLITAPSLTALAIHARTLLNPEHVINMLRRSTASLQLRKLTMESSKDPEVLWEENYGIVCLLAEVREVTDCTLRVSRSADEIVPRLIVKRQVGPGGASARRPSMSAVSAFGYASPSSGGYGAGVSYGGGINYGGGRGASFGVGGGGGAILLPNLQYFSLHDPFCVSTTDLKQMLQSRIANPSVTLVEGGLQAASPEGAVAKLRKARLELSRPPPPKFVELEDLMKGLASEKGIEMSLVV